MRLLLETWKDQEEHWHYFHFENLQFLDLAVSNISKSICLQNKLQMAMCLTLVKTKYKIKDV